MKLNKIVASLIVISGSYAHAGIMQESGTPYTPKPVSVAYAYKIDNNLATKQQVIKIMPSTWKLRLAKNVSFNTTGPVLKEDTWVSYLKRITLENNIKTQLDWNSRVATITMNDDTESVVDKKPEGLLNYAFVEEGIVKDVSILSDSEPSISLREILMTKLPHGWKVKIDKSFDVQKQLYLGKEITLSNLFRQIANELSAFVTINYSDNTITIKKYEYAVKREAKPLPNDTDTSVKSSKVIAATSNTPVITKPNSKAVLESQLEMLKSFEEYLKNDEHITEYEELLAQPMEKQIFLDKQKISQLNIYSMLRFGPENKIPVVANNPFTQKLMEIRVYILSKKHLFNAKAQPFKPQAFAEMMKNEQNSKINQVVEVKRVDPIPAPIVTKIYALELEDKSVLNAIERWAKENGWGFNKEKEMLDFLIEDRKVFNVADIKSAITEVVTALNFYSTETKVKYYVNFSNDGMNKTIMISDRPFDL